MWATEGDRAIATALTMLSEARRKADRDDDGRQMSG